MDILRTLAGERRHLPVVTIETGPCADIGERGVMARDAMAFRE